MADRKTRIRILLLIAPAWLQLSLLNAQEVRTIAVSAVGEAIADPAIVEIVGTIDGRGDLASDAAAKFASAKSAAIEALMGLGIAELDVEANELAIRSVLQEVSPLIRAQRAELPESSDVSVQQALRIRVKGIDQLDEDALLAMLTKIVDAGKDAGIAFGPQVSSVSYSSLIREGLPTYTTFKAADPDALRNEATERAMQNARARAEQLAKLAGGTLGNIRSVQETSSSSLLVTASIRGRAPADAPEVFKKITVGVSMNVQFELRLP